MYMLQVSPPLQPFCYAVFFSIFCWGLKVKNFDCWTVFPDALRCKVAMYAASTIRFASKSSNQNDVTKKCHLDTHWLHFTLPEIRNSRLPPRKNLMQYHGTSHNKKLGHRFLDPNIRCHVSPEAKHSTGKGGGQLDVVRRHRPKTPIKITFQQRHVMGI